MKLIIAQLVVAAVYYYHEVEIGECMAERNKPELIRCNILDDVPVENDAFSGGGHARTAKSLAHAIERFNDADRAIGLEGNWGSGKSTIVEIASKELASNDSKRTYHVFTFDLWANQTIHFRRALLESFLKWGEEKYPDKSSFIIEQQKVVGDRTQTIETKKYKLFTWLGIAILAFLFFMPVFYMWLSPSVLLNPNLDGKLPPLTIISFVVIILMLFLVGNEARRLRSEKENKIENWQQALSSAISPFTKESENTKITQNIRNEDPTQYEFTKTFRRIVEEFQDGKNRLVFVFDNIDRLPNDKIADTWSEVRAVFDVNDPNQNTNSMITAIVPYDRIAVLDALGNSKKSDNQDSVNQTGSKNNYHREDIFRKSFDAILYVAPPVISDAASFFNTKFETALNGSFKQSSALRIYKIFDLHMQDQQRPPTPRQLIAFINSVAALWEQWQGAIPLETIAVYVVHRDLLEQDPGILRDGHGLRKTIVNQANQDNIYRDLAALTYNVDPELAQQVSSHSSIMAALVAEDGSRLQELADAAAVNALGVLLPDIVDEKAEEWAKDSLLDFGNAAKNVEILKVDSAMTDASKRHLLDARFQLKPVPVDKLESYDNILRIVSFSNDSQLKNVVVDLVAWTSNALPTVDERQFAEGQAWIKFIGNLCKKIEKYHGKGKLADTKGQIAVPAGTSFRLGVAYDCDVANLHLRDLKVLNLKGGLLEALTSTIDEDHYRFKFIWPEVKHVIQVSDMNSLLETASAFLKTNSLDDPEVLASCLYNYRQIFIDATGGKSLRNKTTDQLIQDGALYHHAYQMRERDSDEAREAIATALWLVAIRSGNKELTIANPQHPSLGNIQAAYQWFTTKYQETQLDETILDQMANYTIAGKMISNVLNAASEETKERGLFKGVLKICVGKEEAHAPLFSGIIKHYAKIKDILGEQHEQLLILVGKRTDENYWKVDNFMEIPSAMVVDVAKRTESGWKRFNQGLDSWLKNLTASDWTKAFADQDQRVNLLRTRSSSARISIAPTKLNEPLLQHLLNILSGEIVPDDNYDHLVAALPAQTEKAFPGKLFENIELVNASGLEQALAVFGDTMAAVPLSADPEKAVKRILIPLIELRTSDAVNFVSSRKNDFKKVLGQVDEDVKGLVIENLTGLAESTDTEHQEQAQTLRGFLGLTKLKSPSVLKDPGGKKSQ